MNKGILQGKVVVICTDLFEWADWFEKFENRLVANTDLGGARVSTVFLGLDHGYPDTGPLWFETMVFGGLHDGSLWRYATWDMAIKGHGKIVSKVRESLQ